MSGLGVVIKFRLVLSMIKSFMERQLTKKCSTKTINRFMASFTLFLFLNRTRFRVHCDLFKVLTFKYSPLFDKL